MLDLFFGLAQAALTPLPVVVAQSSLESGAEASYDSAAEAYNAGLSFHQNEALFEAMAAYQQAIALDPSFVDPYINLSLIYIGFDQLTEAATLLETVLTLSDHPEDPASIHALAHYNLGIVYSRQGDLAKAQTQVNQALAIAPDFLPAQTLAQQLQRAP
ncbi:MAG: tetratricopeptide repeat protein [Synechococcus sp.]|nr:tetratricopeptide repeat protein [Synechococcus sp.]